MLIILFSQTTLPSRFPHFLLPSPNYPDHLQSLWPGLHSHSILLDSPNPNNCEFGESWFHCPHPQLFLKANRLKTTEGKWWEGVPGSLHLRNLSQRPRVCLKPAPPSPSAFPAPTHCLQLWVSSLPGWVLPFSLEPGRACWGCVGGNHKQNRQEDVQGGPARDAWRSKRGLCPRQRPLLLSARDRLSLGLAPVSCPLKEGESLLPQQKSFLFHSPVLKPDLDLLVTKIQTV